MRVSFSELPSEYPLIRFPKGLVQRKTIILSMSLRPVIECMKGKQTSIDDQLLKLQEQKETIQFKIAKNVFICILQSPLASMFTAPECSHRT